MNIPVDKLVRSKRRTIALIVEGDGSLTVRAPTRATLAAIELFIREKAEWIIRTRARLGSVIQVPKKKYVDGEKFLFLGAPYELTLVTPRRAALKFERGFQLANTAQQRGELLFTRWYKGKALTVLSERVKLFADMHGYVPKRVNITSAKTRWGSCSPDGSLNFTWRLVMAPLEVIDYVVVHELVHLRVKNHSRRFWAAVGKIFPDYRIQRRWLKDHGDQLGL